MVIVVGRIRAIRTAVRMEHRENRSAPPRSSASRNLFLVGYRPACFASSSRAIRMSVRSTMP